jgi:WD40 repeat protein
MILARSISFSRASKRSVCLIMGLKTIILLVSMSIWASVVLAGPSPPPLPESPLRKPEPKSIHLVQTLKHDRPIWSCRFDASGEFLFAGAHDNHMHRWNIALDKQVNLKGHKSWIRRFAFHPDQKTLITGAYEGQLIWWPLHEEQPKPLRTIAAHRGFIRGVAISLDGRYVVTGGNDNLVKVWNATDGTLIAELSGHQRHVYNVAFHPNGKHIISGDLMGVLKQWEVGSWKHVRDFEGGDVLVGWDTKFQSDCGGIRGIDFSPDGKTLAVAGITEVTNAFAGVGIPAVVLFNWKTGKRIRVLKPKTSIQGHCWGLKWHPSGKFIAAVCGSRSGYVSFFKPNEEKSFFDFKLPSVAYDIDIHPDGLRIAAALYDKTIRIYDLAPK